MANTKPHTAKVHTVPKGTNVAPAQQTAAPVAAPQQPAANPLAALAATLVATAPAAPAAKPATVALRGGPAVQSIALTGNPYRTGAAHNASWWATLTAALAAGPQPVAPLLGDGSNGTVPAHFVGYTLRRGYLKAVA